MSMTTPTSVEEQLEVLTQQVAFLVEEATQVRAFKESLSELTSDLSPLARQTMGSVVDALVEVENKGYIDFAKSGIGVIDRVVTSFSQEDVDALGDNVVLILETVKEMTQPQLMQMMRSTIHEVSEIDDSGTPPSMMGLIRQMREPEVRRGLSRMVALLRSMGSIEQGNVEEGKGTGL
ncbi:MAG: DUF1641 domain-containing protein [Actinomycetota bacterium]|nr:DUF1641 domain-containing protein [Actinomycetota bacterium]